MHDHSGESSKMKARRRQNNRTRLSRSQKNYLKTSPITISEDGNNINSPWGNFEFLIFKLGYVIINNNRRFCTSHRFTNQSDLMMPLTNRNAIWKCDSASKSWKSFSRFRSLGALLRLSTSMCQPCIIVLMYAEWLCVKLCKSDLVLSAYANAEPETSWLQSEDLQIIHFAHNCIFFKL